MKKITSNSTQQPHKAHRRTCLGLLFSIMLFWAAEQSHAETCNTVTVLPDEAAKYPFRATGISVSDALRLFSRNLRVGLNVDEGINGTLEVQLTEDVSRIQYLNILADRFNFYWYFDGHILHALPVGMFETRFFPLQENRGTDLINVLKCLGVFQSDFEHYVDNRTQAIRVTGPTVYLDVLASAIEATETAKKTKIVVLRGVEGSVPRALNALQRAENSTALVVNGQ